MSGILEDVGPDVVDPAKYEIGTGLECKVFWLIGSSGQGAEVLSAGCSGGV